MFVIAVALALGPSSAVQAQSYSLVYSFQCGRDGAYPFAGLVSDGGTTFYGTTSRGGTYALGTVFQVTSSGTETVLHSFPAFSTDGYYPSAALIRDAHGNLFGTTDYGGTFGGGTVFKISASGIETILYNFTGQKDGGSPNSLVEDANGVLYGTTYGGGTQGYGTVFKLTQAGVETVLHSFSNSRRDGGFPFSGVVRDTAGNLYGTTYDGGGHGDGTIFKVTAAGSETVLHSFSGGPSDGSNPASGVILNTAGDLLGTTSFGGSSNHGTIFEWSTASVETLLHNFVGGLDDGNDPVAGLLQDGNDIYGTTLLGGSTGCGDSGCGIVFSMTGTLVTPLHSFGPPPTDGHFSDGTLVLGSAGELYGTTYIGGSGQCGTVFKILP